MLPEGKLPLIYRMVEAAAPPQEDGENEAYMAVIRRLRRFSASSLVGAALQLLRADYSSKIEALQTAPWHILLIMKWALRDPHVAFRAGRSVTSHEFNEIRQLVQDLVGSEYRRGKPHNIHLMMRQHMQQFEFQRPESYAFLRWPALIARAPAEHPSRRQLVRELGMPPEHLMDLSYGLFSSVLEKYHALTNDWFSAVQPTYRDSIPAIWSLTSRDFASLRQSVRAEQAHRLPLRQELYEFPYLKRFPFIRLSNGKRYCWHRKVLARGLEDIVHLKLSELGEAYTQPFSRLFEEYVKELCGAMDARTVIDSAYLRSSTDSQANVEAFIPCGDCNVLVEAKMSLFGDDLLLTDNERQAFEKTRHLRKAIKQAWKVGASARSAASLLPNAAKAEEDFLLVVTSRELWVGTGEMMTRLFKGGAFPYPDEAAARTLPLRNVFIISVESLERLSNAVAAGVVCLPDFMREAVRRNEDPTTSAIAFDSVLGRHVSNWGQPELIAQARAQAEERMREAFEDNRSTVASPR